MAQLQFFFAMDEKSVNKHFSKIKEVAKQRRCKIDDKPQKEKSGCYKFFVYGKPEQMKDLRAFLIIQGLPQGYLVE
ncbi:MAG: hypothetical protein A2Y82_03845 [Candidatus Buchananbacteria bacterium RBG_13_36_9]|uniref:Uncharacterized protein n=1 Tax=Candidatus Buchananbacteria bacterium RBG_13_36_9 TaxID=1797530 RepID=A0A1G1XME8_9BACT|nr:MAG: hypothetical protein A2Y82_03845 [Candidatus Buchananbacteria bacterium RBG_13_36_9]